MQNTQPVKVQSTGVAVKKGLATLKFIRTADGKGYIRRQTDNLLKNAKMSKTKKKKKFFRGANYRFDGSIIKKKPKKSQTNVSPRKEKQILADEEKEENPGDVLSYLGSLFFYNITA